MRAVLSDGAHGAQRRQARAAEVLDVLGLVEVAFERGVVHLDHGDDRVGVEQRVVTVVRAAVFAVVDPTYTAVILGADLLLAVLTHVAVHLLVHRDLRDELLDLLARSALCERIEAALRIHADDGAAHGAGECAGGLGAVLLVAVEVLLQTRRAEGVVTRQHLGVNEWLTADGAAHGLLLRLGGLGGCLGACGGGPPTPTCVPVSPVFHILRVLGSHVCAPTAHVIQTHTLTLLASAGCGSQSMQ